MMQLKKIGVTAIVVTPEGLAHGDSRDRGTSREWFTDGHLPLPSIPPTGLPVRSLRGFGCAGKAAARSAK